MMVAGIMNLMSQDLHVSEAVVGQLVTVALTFAICGPILVKLTNRFSSRPVLLWTLLVFIIGNGIIAVAPNFSILVVGRIISSAAAALIIVKVLAITAMLSAPKNRGKMIGLVYTGFKPVCECFWCTNWNGYRRFSRLALYISIFLIIVSIIVRLDDDLFTEGSGNTTRPCES